MTEENTQNAAVNAENGENNQPDYIAKQYRVVRVEDGWKTRKERVGAAWKGANGDICFRPAGKQIFEGDVYLYPFDNDLS